MNLYKELNEEKGYVICDVENLNQFEKIRDTFVKSVNIPGTDNTNIQNVRKKLKRR